jgi:flavin-dependent dehydrogenase
MTSGDYDFLIAGSGPAGSVAACILAEAGAKVGLIDIWREAASFKVGESLPGIGRRLLRLMNMEHVLHPHLPMHQRISCWGSDHEHLAADSLQDPYGTGWWLDRTRFEQDLLKEAWKKGAAPIAGFVSSCQRGDDNQILLQVRVPGQTTRAQLRARWIFDASGRACTIARRLGATREVSHPLWAQYITLSTRLSLKLSVVQSTPQGWWYLAPTTSNQLILMRMQRQRPQTSFSFWEQLEEASAVRRHLLTVDTERTEPRNGRIADASSSITTPFFGLGWCAVGDAAMAFDPLASQGIFHAMQSGYRAAKALLHDEAKAQYSALQDYAGEQLRVWRLYQIQREKIYSAESRWPEELFWSGSRTNTTTAEQSLPYPHSSATRS